MKQIFFSFSLSLCLGSVAFANVAPSTESSSLALQLAKRVASIENYNSLPSRAVWLGQRVAKNSIKLAQKELPKVKKKNRVLMSN